MGELAAVLREASPGALAYLVGATDTGKTTLAEDLAERLAREGPVARVDADPGQARIGPPACLALAWQGAGEPAALRFLGDVTPRGRLLPMVTGVARLVERARAEGAAAIVIDSPGYVEAGAGEALHRELLELLEPRLVVARARGAELEPIIAPFEPRRAVACYRLPAAPEARERSPAERAEGRRERFAGYFADARERTLSLEPFPILGRPPALDAPAAWAERLVAPVDEHGFALALGVARAVEAGPALRIVAPPFDASRVTGLAVGAVAEWAG